MVSLEQKPQQYMSTGELLGATENLLIDVLVELFFLCLASSK